MIYVVLSVLKDALALSLLVFILMTIADYGNVVSRGKMSVFLRLSPARSIVLSSFVSALPGSLGSNFSFCLYIHGLIPLGAMTAALLATSSEAGFLLLALSASKAWMVCGAFFVLGMAGGLLAQHLIKRLKISPYPACYLLNVHLDDECRAFSWEGFKDNFRKPLLFRFLLFFLLVVFSYGVVSVGLGVRELFWQRMVILVLVCIAAGITLTAPNHFIRDHLQHHIRRHMIRIVLWLFFGLLLIEIGMRFYDLETFVASHRFLALFLAILSGLIPASGPQMIFVLLFAQGIIGPSALIANFIVGDGETTLILASHSIRDVFFIKLFKCVLAFIIGGILLLFSL